MSLSKVQGQHAATPAWRLYTHTLDDIRLRARLVAGIPFVGGGLTLGGLHVAYSQHLYPTLFRVLAVAPGCEILRPGDVARVKPHVWDDVDLEDGRHFAVMDERRAIVVIEGFDVARKDAG